MHKQWPFFRTLLSNLDMVLAKSDLRIAARYCELVEDQKLAKRIFSAIKAEWERTHDALSQITGEAERLQSNPALARSIEHRFPYLDPLNHLQVELMRRYRHRKEGRARERAAAARHPPVDQRRGGGVAQPTGSPRPPRNPARNVQPGPRLAARLAQHPGADRHDQARSPPPAG
jgi:hypothetical protein